MKTVVRLENSRFGFDSLREDDVDKLLVFEPVSGQLSVKVLAKPVIIPFGIDEKQILGLISQQFGEYFIEGAVRVIHNRPVLLSYSAPFKIYLDVNKVCQMKCPFCLSDADNRTDVVMAMETITSLAEEMKMLGVMYVKIGGGDPFLHPNFQELIALLRSRGFFLTISTNGVRLNPEIARLLSDAKVRTSVSLEGMEETNDSMRGVGHFKKAMRALEMLKSAEVDAMLRVTLLKANLAEVPQMVQMAKELGTKIRFAYCRPAGRAVHNQMMLDAEDTDGYLKVLEFINRPENSQTVLMDEGMMFEQPQEIVPKLLRGRMCGSANRSMHIDSSGNISPCIFLGPTFVCGKVHHDGSISDFWSGRVGNMFTVVREARQPQECNGCDRLCKSECLANRFYFWGDFSKEDPNCLVCAIRHQNQHSKQ